MSQWKNARATNPDKLRSFPPQCERTRLISSSCLMTYTHILWPPHMHTQIINIFKWIVTFIDVCLHECIQLFVCTSSEANEIIRLSAVWVTGNLKLFLENKLSSSVIARNALNYIAIPPAMIIIFKYVVTVLMKHPYKVFEEISQDFSFLFWSI